MAVTVTIVKNGHGIGAPCRFRVAGLAAGKNSINLTTAVSDLSVSQQLIGPPAFIPSGALITPMYDGSHAVASKFQYDPATLSGTNIDIYCDAVGGTSCEVELT